jgi:hypothetical protein
MKQRFQVNKNIKKKRRKLATFTFFGSETRTITKLFKNRDIVISYRTKNNIKHALKTKENKEENKYSQSGIYQLQCNECPKRYIGQIGRTFEIRYREHVRDIKNDEHNSKYAQHILDTTHEYGQIQKIMKPLYIGKKGPLLDT